MERETEQALLAARCEAEPPRGECTIVVAGATGETASPSSTATQAEREAALDAELEAGLAQGESVRDLASRVAAKTGRARRDVYARAVALRGAAARSAPADEGGRR